jgi:hypothetical protein
VVEWTELSTIPRVRPLLTLVDDLDEWRGRFDHAHLIVRLVLRHVPRSPHLWATSRGRCEATRAMTHDIPRLLPIN